MVLLCNNYKISLNFWERSDKQTKLWEKELILEIFGQYLLRFDVNPFFQKLTTKKFWEILLLLLQGISITTSLDILIAFYLKYCVDNLQ